MVEIGRINHLRVLRRCPGGVQLDGGRDGTVMLPNRHIPKGTEIGDELEVFVYANKSGRLQASGQRPTALVGDFACLQVVANSSDGAYLDWGLQKDLLVPKLEQHIKMLQGRYYVIRVFLDEKSRRITASSKLDKFLDLTEPAYREGEEVGLFVARKTDLGFKAIINRSHWGVIYKNEIFAPLRVGQELRGFIKKIRPDGKIDLRLQRPGLAGISAAAQDLYQRLSELGGHTEITDKSAPEEISAAFAMSKKSFKRAVGALYKRRLIKIDPDEGGISLTKKKG